MFEFDPAKSAANKAKHGIDFVGAQAVWDDERRLTIQAREGAGGEPRHVAIGLIGAKMWTVVFAWRNDRMRIISARRSRDDERRLYDGQGD